MRKAVSIALVMFGLGTVVTGLRQIFIPAFATMELDIGHISNSCVFAILFIIHAWLNRKPVIRYFGELGWWWIPVGLAFAVVIWGSVGITVLVALGML